MPYKSSKLRDAHIPLATADILVLQSRPYCWLVLNRDSSFDIKSIWLAVNDTALMKFRHYLIKS